MASADVGYSGSTVAAAFVQTVGEKRLLHTANCGDARIVLCRNGQAQRLTVDHKVIVEGGKVLANLTHMWLHCRARIRQR